MKTLVRNILVSLAVILCAFIIACQQDKPKADSTTRTPRTKTETPCEGRLVLRHAYSECQDDGFWHTVEDNYIICREDNTERRFRVFDMRTTQACQPISPRPPVIGNGYTAHSSVPLYSDSSCYEDGTITISECEFGMWIERRYTLTICENGRVKLIRPTGDSAVATIVACDQPVPRPAR